MLYRLADPDFSQKNFPTLTCSLSLNPPQYTIRIIFDQKKLKSSLSSDGSYLAVPNQCGTIRVFQTDLLRPVSDFTTDPISKTDTRHFIPNCHFVGSQLFYSKPEKIISCGLPKLWVFSTIKKTNITKRCYFYVTACRDGKGGISVKSRSNCGNPDWDCTENRRLAIFYIFQAFSWWFLMKLCAGKGGIPAGKSRNPGRYCTENTRFCSAMSTKSGIVKVMPEKRLTPCFNRNPSV